MERRSRQTWFATLRRDRGIFALFAFLLLVMQALEPLAASASAINGGELIICTSVSADTDSQGGTLRHEGCAKCIAGACGIAYPAKALVPDVAAWASPPSLVSPLWEPAEKRPPAIVPALPPAIRAPPFAV